MTTEDDFNEEVASAVFWSKEFKDMCNFLSVELGTTDRQMKKFWKLYRKFADFELEIKVLAEQNLDLR